MGQWSKTFDRARTDIPRREDDLTKQIEGFFNSQKEDISYSIVDTRKGIVDVDGSLHLDQNDLDENGELWFRIGRLTGNLYFHGKHFKPTVIPAELGGEVIFVQEETDSRGQKGNNKEEDDDLNMGLLTKKEVSKEDIVSSIKSAVAGMFSSKYRQDIDIQEIIDAIKKDWEAQDKYNLKIDYPKTDSLNVYCNIYVHDDDFYVPEGEERKPLRFNAIQTAYYLMFILKKDGIVIDKLKKDDWELVKQIYTRLAHRVEKTYITDKDTGHEDEYTNGVMNQLFTLESLRSYLSEIRTIIQKRIPYKSIANKFAIEGYRGQPFGVAIATDEMRAEIREKFGLD